MASYNGMMSDEKKTILKINHQKIVENMADVEDVLGILFANEIITRDFMETVLSKPTNRGKIRELLLALHRYGDIAFNGLLVALEQTKQMDLVNQISPNFMGQDAVDSDYAEISTIESYDFEDLPMKHLVKAEIHRVVTDNKNYKIRNHEKVGRAIIINNKEFDYLDLRGGSEVDVDLLRACLEKLNFKVNVHLNLTAMQIRETLKLEQSTLSEDIAAPVDVYIVILMSHGAKDYVYGTDGQGNVNMVSLAEVQEFFDAENCPVLIERPKLFFFQACQRDEVIPKKEDIEEIRGSLIWRNVETRREKVKTLIKTHKSSDIFIMISTVPGYLSWRHSEKGSFFIRTLVYAITTKCHKKEFLSIMTDVQRLLTGIEIKTKGGPIIQQPELRSTLRKYLYFLP